MATPITPRLYYRAANRAVVGLAILLGMGATLGLQAVVHLSCGAADGRAIAGIMLGVCVVVVLGCAVSIRQLMGNLTIWAPLEGEDWPAEPALATEPDASD